MSLLPVALSMLASHAALYSLASSEDLDGAFPLWFTDNLTTLVETRCPDEWADYLAVQPGGLGIKVVELPAAHDHALRVVWRDWNLPFGDQYEHFISFTFVGASQVSSALAYIYYVRTGEVKYLEGNPDPAALHAEFAAKTALMTCMYPSEKEVGWDVHSFLWPKILESIECANWISSSEAMLELNVGDAGTPEANDALRAILEGTTGQCEKDQDQ